MAKAKQEAPPNKNVRAFRKMAKEYFAESFERFPVVGGGAGIARLNEELGSAKPQVFERQSRLALRTLAAVENLPMHDFAGNDWLDRKTFLSHLRLETMNLGDVKTWQINPQVHLESVAEGIHSLIVRNGDNLKPVAKAIVSRLRAVPRYLDEAALCIDCPVPLWTRLARESASGIISLFKSLPDPLTEASDYKREVLERWVKEASSAVRKYASRIGRKKPGPENGFALGQARFETMIAERLGMNITAREAAAAAHGLIEQLKGEIKKEARNFHPRKSPREILEDAAMEWRPAGTSLLSTYKQQTRAMKSTFRSHKIVSFPTGDRLLVKLVPEFMIHHFPTAAYSAPGPLDKNQTGIFWVNDLSLYLKSEKNKRAEIAQHFGMELTSAHEAYPGHHLQFVTQFRHPSLVRKMADHAIFYEGWTLWCEQMSVDLKVSNNPYLRLIQLNDALWRANRIVIDCGLQTGTMSYDGACRRLQREVGFTRARAEADVNWYTSSPTIPMSYLLGKMELLRLKERKIDREGWTLKQFNDWALSFGAIPWSWIEASGL